MGKKKKTGKSGMRPAPTREEQEHAATVAKKKEKKKAFLKQISESARLVVFNGQSSISHFGFNSDGDFLLFMLDQIYGWDGTNSVFQNVLKSIEEQSKANAVQAAELDVVDEVFDEMEEEATPVLVDDAEDVVDGDEDEDEDEKVEEDEPDPPKEEVKKLSEAQALRQRLAVLEGSLGK